MPKSPIATAPPLFTLLLALLAPAQTPTQLQVPILRNVFQAAAAYDEGRQRVVMVGSDVHTWEWDGVAWSRHAPAVHPGPRSGHAMAYDRARGVVLYGGYGSSTDTDTWLWNGNTWTKLATAFNPGSIGGHAMAYDAMSQRVVLYGGTGSAGTSTSTWSWDGSAWRLHTPATNPGPRMVHAMAPDPISQRIVLFGGWPGSGVAGDTWLWDGSNWTLQPTTSAPAARGHAAMAYDLGRQEVVLFGGEDAGGTVLSDTWSWNGAAWSLRAANTVPLARYGHAMAYDAARQSVVLCGGCPWSSAAWPQHPTFLADTWQWDGATWRECTSEVPTLGPSYSSCALVHDPARATSVLLLENTLLEWSQGRWLRRSPTTGPAPRVGFAAAHDAARQRTVMFAGGQTGLLQDTWQWDGTSWMLASPPVSPSARAQHAMAYDSVHQRIVLFGGADATGFRSDTWEWDGSNWIQRAPLATPAPRASHSMTFDTLRQRIVLFGGYDALGSRSDTWEFDGVDWIQASPATSPTTPISPAPMAHDSVRQRSVLFSPGTGETWEWDGVTWTLTNQSGLAGLMVFDSTLGRMLVVRRRGTGGPLSPQQYWSETWFHGDLTPASSLPIGSGCSGSNGIPVLGSHAPALGNGQFELTLFEAMPNTVAVLGLDVATQTLPLGGGCTLYLSPTPVSLLLVFPDATGFARLPAPIPANPALRGFMFYAQAAVLDPQGAAAGLVLTAARQLVVGD